MGLNDLSAIGEPEKEPDGKSQDGSAAGQNVAILSQELEEAKRSIARHRVCWLLLALAGVTYWDSIIFRDYQSWAPTIAILILELFGFFILAYTLDMKEVVQLFWAAIRGYAQQDPGSPPEAK